MPGDGAGLRNPNVFPGLTDVLDRPPEGAQPDQLSPTVIRDLILDATGPTAHFPAAKNE